MLEYWIVTVILIIISAVLYTYRSRAALSGKDRPVVLDGTAAILSDWNAHHQPDNEALQYNRSGDGRSRCAVLRRWYLPAHSIWYMFPYGAWDEYHFYLDRNTYCDGRRPPPPVLGQQQTDSRCDNTHSRFASRIDAAAALLFCVVLDGCNCDYFMEKIIVLKQRITAGFTWIRHFLY